MKVLCLLTGVFLLHISALCAEDNDERIKKIVADVQKSLESQKTATPPLREPQSEGAGQLLGQLLAGAGSEDATYRETALTQLAYLVESGPVRQECLDLAATLHGEREASEKKMAADINAVIDRAPATVRAAKTAPELDDLVLELGKYRSDRADMTSSRPVMSAVNRAQTTLRFVTQWQDYLSELTAGETERAVQSLQSLSQQEVYLVPRSEILERIHNGGKARIATPGENPTSTPEASPAPTPVILVGPDVSKLVAEIKTLDALAPALDELEKLSRSSGDTRQADAGTALKFLAPFDQSYRDFLAGQSTKVNLDNPALPMPGGRYPINIGGEDELARVIRRTELALRDQLLAVTLPRYLDLPGSITARPGEGPIDFLDRRKAEALAAGDYLGVAKADEARTFLRSGGSHSMRAVAVRLERNLPGFCPTASTPALASATMQPCLSKFNLLPDEVLLDASLIAHALRRE